MFSRSEINPVPVNALEFSSTLFVCPDDLYVVYLWAESYGTSAKNDLLPLVKKMFNFNQKMEKLDELNDLKPSVLWSCYFNCEYIDCDQQTGFNDHHFIASTPSSEIDYDKAIREVSLRVFYFSKRKFLNFNYFSFFSISKGKKYIFKNVSRRRVSTSCSKSRRDYV